MKEILLSVLRDKNSSTAEFRKASDHMAHLLSAETLSKMKHTHLSIETPVGTAVGAQMPTDVMVVAIMRAAIAILPAFTQVIPQIPVGFMGIERDEATAQPKAYYTKLPQSLPSRAIILDPMLATGGSACLTVDTLRKTGFKAQDIYFTGVIASQEGLERLSESIPLENITLAAIDPELNEMKYIVPGLGDYGDRYYGT